MANCYLSYLMEELVQYPGVSPGFKELRNDRTLAAKQTPQRATRGRGPPLVEREALVGEALHLKGNKRV
jgi:hypothetical protein